MTYPVFKLSLCLSLIVLNDWFPAWGLCSSIAHWLICSLLTKTFIYSGEWHLEIRVLSSGVEEFFAKGSEMLELWCCFSTTPWLSMRSWSSSVTETYLAAGSEHVFISSLMLWASKSVMLPLSTRPFSDIGHSNWLLLYPDHFLI